MTRKQLEQQILEILNQNIISYHGEVVLKGLSGSVKEITSLIEQKPDCYSAEFIVWIGFMSSRLVYYRERDDKWLFTKDLDKIDEWTEFTLDELYDYWKNNIKDKEK